MKKNKKALLDLLTQSNKRSAKFEALVLNLALQKIDSDNFEFDGEAVYTVDKKEIIFCLSNRETFTIPTGVETVGAMAFRSKKHLKTIVIPSTVVTIEHDAFYDCDDLDNVYIPASVSTIRGYAFAECDQLHTVTFGGKPLHLSRHTFSECDDLRTIYIPKDTTPYFQKVLHYTSDTDEFLFIEKGEMGEVTGEAPVEQNEAAAEENKENVKMSVVEAMSNGTTPQPEEPKADNDETEPESLEETDRILEKDIDKLEQEEVAEIIEESAQDKPAKDGKKNKGDKKDKKDKKDKSDKKDKKSKDKKDKKGKNPDEASKDVQTIPTDTSEVQASADAYPDETVAGSAPTGAEDKSEEDKQQQAD